MFGKSVLCAAQPRKGNGKRHKVLDATTLELNKANLTKAMGAKITPPSPCSSIGSTRPPSTSASSSVPASVAGSEGPRSEAGEEEVKQERVEAAAESPDGYNTQGTWFRPLPVDKLPPNLQTSYTAGKPIDLDSESEDNAPLRRAATFASSTTSFYNQDAQPPSPPLSAPGSPDVRMQMEEPKQEPPLEKGLSGQLEEVLFAILLSVLSNLQFSKIFVSFSDTIVRRCAARFQNLQAKQARIGHGT